MGLSIRPCMIFNPQTMPTTKIALFQGQSIRKVFHEQCWWFSVIDVVAVLTGSTNPRDYWFKMKLRVKTEDGFEASTVCRQFKLKAADGKLRATDCADTAGILRIIQSIPSPKAEPFKRWLAQVGYERMQEIENPEVAIRRTKIFYKQKGYQADWIENRIRSMAIREELTDEWHKRGAQAHRDYEMLTAEISKATFGVTPRQYKQLKGLQGENLRDHMDDFELIFTMLGERSTTAIHRNEDSRGVPKLKDDARCGGQIAGHARAALEQKLGKSIVTKNNFKRLNKPGSRRAVS